MRIATMAREAEHRGKPTTSVKRTVTCLRSASMAHSPARCSTRRYAGSSWAGAFEYLVNVAGGTPIHVSNICPVRHEPAGQRKFFNAMKRRQLVGYCETRNALLIAKGERVFDR